MRLGKKLRERVDQLAEESEVPRVEVIRALLRQGLKAVDFPEKDDDEGETGTPLQEA